MTEIEKIEKWLKDENYPSVMTMTFENLAIVINNFLRSNTVAPVDNIVESGFNSELKGWIALFKDEKNYLDFLKWQREQTKEVSNNPLK